MANTGNTLMARLKHSTGMVEYQLSTIFDKPHNTENRINIGLLDDLSNIMFDLFEAEELLIEFIKKHNVEERELLKQFYQAKKYLQRAHILLIHSLNYQNDNDVTLTLDYIYSAIACWNDKFMEELGLAQHHMFTTKSGFILDNQFYIFQKDGDSDDEDFQAGISFSRNIMIMLNNARRAEKLFFNLENHPEFSTLIHLRNKIHESIFNSMNGTFDIQKQNGRTIISAYTSAIALKLYRIDTKCISSNTQLSIALGLASSGKRLKTKTGYIHRNVNNSEMTVCSQYRPSLGHTGNHFINGIGRYANKKTNDILSVINTITGRNQERESKLATLFLRYKGGDSNAFSYESLRENGMDLRKSNVNDTLIKRLYRLAYLFCFIEVIRRENPGVKKGRLISELPFNTAICCALVLIRDKFLSMNDVFSCDALYGVVTGTSITDQNILLTIKKFNHLFETYINSYSLDAEDLLDEISVDHGINVEDFSFVPTEAVFLQLFQEVDEGRQHTHPDVNLKLAPLSDGIEAIDVRTTILYNQSGWNA